MLKVPASLSGAFETQLGQRKIPDQQRRDFHKWLGFVDFDETALTGVREALLRLAKISSEGQIRNPRAQSSPSRSRVLPYGRHSQIAVNAH